MVLKNRWEEGYADAATPDYVGIYHNAENHYAPRQKDA